MVDLVYILGRGSHWENNEIRYSLRSVEKHLSGFANVYIVGELPDFLKNVRHISMRDDNFCKENNIYFKVLRACQEASISDDFLFFNDDHFLNANFVADQFPYYHKGDIVNVVKRLKNKYRRCCLRTVKTLAALKLPTDNFDSHAPILYNKQKFIDHMTKYDWGIKIGYILKSLYCNTLKIKGVREPDCKINTKMSYNQIITKITPRTVWSIGDDAICDDLKKVMDELYPNPSRWEK